MKIKCVNCGSALGKSLTWDDWDSDDETVTHWLICLDCDNITKATFELIDLVTDPDY